MQAGLGGRDGERVEQRPADAVPAGLAVDVHRVLGHAGVGRPRRVRAHAREADHVAAELGDEHGQPGPQPVRRLVGRARPLTMNGSLSK